MLKSNRVVMLSILLLAGIALLAGCAATGAGCCSKKACPEPAVAPAPPPPPAEVSDDELSYRNVPLTADGGTPAVSFDAAEPGDSELAPRAFENAPPMIPHTVDGLLPITRDDNQCAGCHTPENAADVGATSVPASHLYDMRNDRQLTDLNPANYNCTLCHAPQANTDALVANSFEPFYRALERRNSSNLLDTLNEGVK